MRSTSAPEPAAGPAWTDTMCESPGSGGSPSEVSAARSAAALRPSFSTRRGSSRSRPSAAMAPATAGGAGAVEWVNVRAAPAR